MPSQLPGMPSLSLLLSPKSSLASLTPSGSGQPRASVATPLLAPGRRPALLVSFLNLHPVPSSLYAMSFHSAWERKTKHFFFLTMLRCINNLGLGFLTCKIGKTTTIPNPS